MTKLRTLYCSDRFLDPSVRKAARKHVLERDARTMRVLRIGAGVVGGALLLLAAFTCGVRWGQGRQSHLYHNGPPVAQGRLGTQVHRLRTETDDVNADADRPPRPPPPRPPPPREAQEHDKDEHIHIEVDSGNESLSLRIIAVFATAGITLLGLAPFFHSAAKALSESVLICIRAGAAGMCIFIFAYTKEREKEGKIN